MTYRDFQIESDLRNAEMDAWYTEIVDSITRTEGDTKYVRTDLVLSAA